MAQTQEAEDVFDEYLPCKREKNYDKFWERRTFESTPPKQEDRFKIEEKAVPEESSTEQSTPVQEEAVSPTPKGQPTIEKLPPDLPPEGEDTTEQVGTVEDASVVAKEETTPVKEVKV